MSLRNQEKDSEKFEQVRNDFRSSPGCRECVRVREGLVLSERAASAGQEL